MSVIDNKLLISKAADKALRPLVRLLIHWGIGYKDFVEHMKIAFMHEAAESIKKQNKQLTASDLSLVSGIHRKEASAFLKSGDEEEVNTQPRKESAAFTIFSEWTSNPDYLDSKGTPTPLTYLHSDNDKSFTNLCESITRDVRPRAILDEFVRLDLAEINDDIVRLKKDAFVPAEDLEKKLAFFQRNISEHLNAAASNIIGEQEPLFERMASHGHLTKEDVEELKQYIDKKGMEILKTVYQKTEKMAEKNNGNDEAVERFSLGIFLNHKAE